MEQLLVSFPYRKRIGGEQSFPILSVRVFHKKESTEVFTLIDSGATISVFRPEVAGYLGIEIENGTAIDLNGVGGWIRGYLHELDIEVAGRKFNCPIIFSHEYTVSLNLLGRESFFEKFVIIFDEKKKELRLE
jgi:hypothetical protein